MCDENTQDGGGDEELVVAEDADSNDAIVYDERGMFGPVGGPKPGWPPAPEPRPPAGAWFGALAERPQLRWPLERFPLARACSTGTLNGSWFLRFTGGVTPFRELRGPLRIEAASSRIRVSGDIYRWELSGVSTRTYLPVEHVTLPREALIINRNWYPQFPKDQYSWYFRSTGVTYSGGMLEIPFTRHLWNRSQQAFTSTDTGWLRLSCSQEVLRQPFLPRPTVRMTGQAMVGGTTYPVEAVKTSPYYRGCRVEVDVMANRTWPATAVHGAGTTSFTGVYRAQGIDFSAVVNQTDIPEQASLTVANLHTLLATHRGAVAAGAWHLWLLVGSRLGTGNTYGVMFDEAAPHREGAVGFADATLPDQSYVEQAVRGLALNAVPSAFLRTLIHEAGHAFNLYHPKHDVHAPPVGRTIMNQTGDVMSFASASDPYPGNAQFAFDEHSATSLIHSPDPQIAPGWRDFGWGHGSLWSGAAEPTDVAGLADDGPSVDTGLRLELRLPDQAVRGEIVVAEVTVENTGEIPRSVTAALNLAEGDLKMVVDQPSGDTVELRDVVVACGPRRMVELQPGEVISGSVQLFYTNQGFAFDQPGLYRLAAVLDVGDGSGETLRSASQQLELDLPLNDEERALADLTMDAEVGLAVAFGDTGGNEDSQERLGKCMDRFVERDTGAVAALVLANSYSRTMIDLSDGTVSQEPDGRAVEAALDKAVETRTASEVVRLAIATVSPAEPDAPVLDAVLDHLRSDGDAAHDSVDIVAAERRLHVLRAE